jgi:hypothetical protein
MTPNDVLQLTVNAATVLHIRVSADVLMEVIADAGGMVPEEVLSRIVYILVKKLGGRVVIDDSALDVVGFLTVEHDLDQFTLTCTGAAQ